MDDTALRDTVDHVAVRRLQAAYADIVTRRAWPELADVFLPDATVTVDRRAGDPLVLTGPGAVGDFIGGAIGRFSFFEFVILNVHLTLRVSGDPDVATARMYMCELRQERDGGRFTTAFGLYQDRYRRQDGRWWFDRRWYHSLARTSQDLDVFPFPAPPTELT